MATSPPAIVTKKFKRGEQIFVAGSRATHIYVIQTGLVSVSILKNECIQLYIAGPKQSLREEALTSGPPSGISATALRDTQVLEIPIEFIRTHIKAADPVADLLIKGLVERLKISANELRSHKMARQSQPCPPDLTAKVFGIIFYSARYIGKKDGETYVAKWDVLKDYAVEVMEEDPIRVQEGIHILAKLNYAEPWGADGKKAATIPPVEQWTQICFRNMNQIETFFDFYQNYHFKSGYAGLLKTNDKATAITQALVRLSDKYQIDRAGMVSMPYKATVDSMKEVMGKTFEADQIFRLDQKGLMVKQTNTQEGGVLSFFKPEFEQMLLNWKVLKEVELWNERGYVELSDTLKSDGAPAGAPLTSKDSAISPQSNPSELDSWKPLVLSGGAPKIRTEPARPNEILCPHCMTAVTAAQKYCTVCDCELPKKAG